MDCPGSYPKHDRRGSHQEHERPVRNGGALPPILGSGPATGQDGTLSEGQTYQINGWTIEPEESRTKFTYDATGEGMYFGDVTMRQF